MPITSPSVQISLTAQPTKEIVDVRQDGNGPRILYSIAQSLTIGAGAGAVNTAWTGKNTALAYGANDDWDIYNGLTDCFGDAITNARIKYLLVVNLGTAAAIHIGAAGTTPWYPWISGSGDYLILPPGTSTNASFVLLGVPNATGYAVTNGGADMLRISHASDVSDDASYQIALFGAAT